METEQEIILAKIKDYKVIAFIESKIKEEGLLFKTVKKENDNYYITTNTKNKIIALSQLQQLINKQWSISDKIQMQYAIIAKRRSVIKDIAIQSQPLTTIISLICITLYAICNINYNAETIINNLLFFNNVPSSINEFTSNFWRVITPSILHIDILHLSFNLTWWWYIGNKIEKKYSFWVLLKIFIVSAAISNCAQFYSSSNNLFLGISGVNYGIIGFCWMKQILFKQTIIEIEIIYASLLWMIICFSGIVPINIANTAHLAGLIAGLITGLLKNKSHN